MAKGDRDNFKADTDDGYTKIANLLLEALAMSKLNGIQKGICLFLWRRTYGWGQKEDQISLKEFAQACSTSEQYISRQIKQLVNCKVIIRTSYQPGKAPTYTYNTRVAEWDKDCIDVQGLHDCAIQGLYICAIQGLHDCARVNQPLGHETQGLEPCLKKDLKKDKEINDDTADSGKLCENLYSIFENEFARPLGPMEITQLTEWINNDKLTNELILEALRRAVFAGKFKFSYISSILFDWLKNNIRTMQEVQERDKEFKDCQSKKQDNKSKSRASPQADTWGNPKNVDKEKELLRQLYNN